MSAVVPPPAPRTEAASVGPPASACANCDADRLGDYCHACGQHHLEGRLTLRSLWREFAARFLKLERGLLHTAIGLTKDPGGTARHYVNGARRRYTNPLGYLLLASAFMLLLYGLYEEVVMEQVREQFARQMEGYKASTQETLRATYGDDPAAMYVALMEYVKRFNAYLTLLLVLPFALLLRLFLGGTQRNTAECTVLALYVVAQTTIYLGVTMPAFMMTGTVLSGVLTMGVYLGMAAWGAAGFFGRTVANAALGAVSMLLAYAGYLVVITALGMIAVFGDLLAAEGITWGDFFAKVRARLTG